MKKRLPLASQGSEGMAAEPFIAVDTDGELLPLSKIRLLALTVGLLGIQYCWSVQVGYVTRTLLVLGMSPQLVSYAWLAGPIAGIIVQPIVGAWSDRCTARLGRRRPFLIGGACITAVCLLVFAYARELGIFLGDVPDKSGQTGNHRIALSLAVAAFWALDFSLNGAQGPLRALLADRVPKSQHPEANAYFSLMTGLGNLLGSGAGAIKLSKYLTFFPEDITALYASAVFFIIVCMGTTVIFTKETPLEPSSPSLVTAPYTSMDEEEPESFLASLWLSWRTAPEPFHRLFAIQCCTWFGWFTIFVFGASWIGQGVYGGSAEAPPGSAARELYESGVRAGNLGLALQSVITVGFSLAIPGLLKSVGTRTVYFGGHIVLAVTLLASIVTFSSPLAVAELAATGFPWSITMTVPWALMGQGVSKRAPGKEGVYFTLFNLSQCFPEVVVSVVSPLILSLAKEQQAAVLFSGGLIVLLGAVGIIVLKVGDDDEQEYESPR